MKAGTFNIHNYLNKLHEAEVKPEEPKTENIDPDSIVPKESKKAYDWLKKEFKKGKTEVKVEMSYHTFKPGYSTEGAKDFKPGMYGQVKTSENNIPKDNTPKFPETKFPGTEGSTKSEEGNLPKGETGKVADAGGTPDKSDDKTTPPKPKTPKVEAKTVKPIKGEENDEDVKDEKDKKNEKKKVNETRKAKVYIKFK